MESGATSSPTTWSGSPAATGPYCRWTGSAWDKKEGADIPEVDIAFETCYPEGAMYWKLLDISDTDRLKAVRVSKGEFRDYVPRGDYALGGQILGGGIKSQ